VREVKFDPALDVRIRETIECAKERFIAEGGATPNHALNYVTMRYIFTSAEGLYGSSSYMRRSHIDGVARFVSEFRGQNNINWINFYIISSQIIDYDQIYFPNLLPLLKSLASDMELAKSKFGDIYIRSIENLMFRAQGYSADESFDIRQKRRQALAAENTP
jgi:hypothetical protein